MGTTFWLITNSEGIYAHMSRGPLVCVGTLVFSRINQSGNPLFILLNIINMRSFEEFYNVLQFIFEKNIKMCKFVLLLHQYANWRKTSTNFAL